MTGGNTYVGDGVLTAKTRSVVVTVNSQVGAAAVGGANVTLSADAATTAQSQGPQLTDSAGKITFNQVQPGDYTVVVDGSSASPTHVKCGAASQPLCTITPSGPPTGGIRVHLDDPDSLSLTATIPEGVVTGLTRIDDGHGPHPTQDVTVMVANDVAGVSVTPTIGPDGRYAAFVPANSYNVSFNVAAGGFVVKPTGTDPTPGTNPVSVTVTSGSTTTADVVMVAVHNVPISVVSDAGSTALAGAKVQLIPATTSCATTTQAPTTTDGAGGTNYSLQTPGNYRICVDGSNVAPKYRTADVLLTVPVTSTDPIATTIVMLHQQEAHVSGTAKLQVTTSGGSPVTTLVVTNPSNSVTLTIRDFATDTTLIATPPVGPTPTGSYSVLLPVGKYKFHFNAGTGTTEGVVTVTVQDGVDQINVDGTATQP